MKVKRTSGASNDAPLVLDGEDLCISNISVDGRNLGDGYDRVCCSHVPSQPEIILSGMHRRREYSWTQSDTLEIKGPLPEEFTLATECTIKPEVTQFTINSMLIADWPYTPTQENTQLNGLYQSSGKHFLHL